MSYLIIGMFVVFLGYLFFESRTDSDGDIDFIGLSNISKDSLTRIREDERLNAQKRREKLASESQVIAARVLEKLPELCKKQADNGFYYAKVMSLFDCHSVREGCRSYDGEVEKTYLEYSDLLGAGKIVFDYLQQNNMSPFLDGWSIVISWAPQEAIDKCISQRHSTVRGEMYLCYKCNICFPERWLSK